VHAKLKEFLNSCRSVIKLKDIDVELCYEYAEAVYDTNKDEYKRRNQDNKETILRQNVCGKLAELGVYDFLNSLGVSATFPDFNIYPKEEKNFSPDIYFEKESRQIGCHIKAQDVAQTARYSASWLFQKHSDPLVVKPEEHVDELLVFVQIDGLSAKIMGVVWAREIASFLKAPRLAHLESKVALYYDDLVEAGVV